jgi:hypothetical protein
VWWQADTARCTLKSDCGLYLEEGGTTLLRTRTAARQELQGGGEGECDDFRTFIVAPARVAVSRSAGGKTPRTQAQARDSPTSNPGTGLLGAAG